MQESEVKLILSTPPARIATGVPLHCRTKISFNGCQLDFYTLAKTLSQVQVQFTKIIKTIIKQNRIHFLRFIQFRSFFSFCLFSPIYNLIKERTEAWGIQNLLVFHVNYCVVRSAPNSVCKES